MYALSCTWLFTLSVYLPITCNGCVAFRGLSEASFLEAVLTLDTVSRFFAVTVSNAFWMLLDLLQCLSHVLYFQQSHSSSSWVGGWVSGVDREVALLWRGVQQEPPPRTQQAALQAGLPHFCSYQQGWGLFTTAFLIWELNNYGFIILPYGKL